MDRKNYFQQYESRLNRESWVKSAICGLIVGASLAFLAAFITWFFPRFNGLWLSIGVLVLGTAAATPVFYSTLFKPTVMGNARRLDRFGLDERLVTMIEYEANDSYIAQRQREDAQKQLNKLDVKSIKFDIPKKIIVAMSICAFLGVSMTTVTGLSDIGILPSGDEVLDEIIPDPPIVQFEVNYEVFGDGEISGDPNQLVEQGKGSETVIAVPEDGFMFAGWDDGYKNPVRFDSNIQEDTTYYAIFLPLQDGGGGDGDQPGEPGDKPSNMPGESNKPSHSKDPSQKPGNAGGGKYEDYNQIIDGNTYYKDEGVFDVYYEQAMEQLAQIPDLPPELRAIVESYFNVIG